VHRGKFHSPQGFGMDEHKCTPSIVVYAFVACPAFDVGMFAVCKPVNSNNAADNKAILLSSASR